MSTDADTSKIELSMPTEEEEDKEKITFKSRLGKALKEARGFDAKKMKDYIGPTGFWLISYYGVSIFIMICMNIARVGWSAEAIFAAPAYFAQLFINYGLNAGQVRPSLEEDTIYYEKIEFGRALESASWLFAPWIVYALGLVLSILSGSGYPMPEGEYDYLFNFQYFHERTVALNDNKRGGFYFILVWLPIILSILIGAFITKRLFEKKEDRYIGLMKIAFWNLLIGFIVGLQMGKMTGDFIISISGFFATLFGFSDENTAVRFGRYVIDEDGDLQWLQGQYHPNAIMITSWFVNLIPLILAAVWYRIYDNLEDRVIDLVKEIKQRRKSAPTES